MPLAPIAPLIRASLPASYPLVTSPRAAGLVIVVQTADGDRALACRPDWIVESHALPVKRGFGLEAIR
jgi:hypothetical protein